MESGKRVPAGRPRVRRGRERQLPDGRGDGVAAGCGGARPSGGAAVWVCRDERRAGGWALVCRQQLVLFAGLL